MQENKTENYYENVNLGCGRVRRGDPGAADRPSGSPYVTAVPYRAPVTPVKTSLLRVVLYNVGMTFRFQRINEN